ncbi:ABC transporter ATP-binding protein [Devosia sp. PTR5]|uniref:ABC transporter ATP-binding protein n=1 Tax=Devosia oryzisoli TaxID=2774138 RepID=A0A927IUM4_9HYPH|nr:ABC transporter ATP-binding protein [Devosia oryzisoli]MBD8066856.1 ABC transporter ATP-binding protein [Devosia oryzisoli]
MSDLVITAAHKRYGKTIALDAVSLTIAAGSRVAIVGPSGSGKTTLLRAIAGFETLDAGSIRLGEIALEDDKGPVPSHRRQIGYVVQEGALFPHMSVADNVRFGMIDPPSARGGKAAELLQRVGLPPDVGMRRPHELSGGQQQRVALARAMARSPKVMLLDEPFSALDTGLRDAIRDMVSSVLGEAGITTVLVTHDQKEALSFADRVAVMQDGRLVQAGTPEEVYLKPVNAQTARFLGDAIILNAMVQDGTAHTLLGPVRATGPSGPRTIMLRPEQVRITPATGEGQGSRGRIVARSYEGPTWRTVVEHLPDATDEMVLETASLFTISVPGPASLPAGTVVAIAVVGEAHSFPARS